MVNRIFPPGYTKTCPRCKKAKPANEYSTRYRGADPLDIYCKQCRREMYRAAHGGIVRLFAKFTDEEIKAEFIRRGLTL